jgi:hypothetical protein
MLLCKIRLYSYCMAMRPTPTQCQPETWSTLTQNNRESKNNLVTFCRRYKFKVVNAWTWSKKLHVCEKHRLVLFIYLFTNLFRVQQFFMDLRPLRRDRVVSIHSSCSGNPGFKSRPGDWLSWMRVFVLSSVPPGECRNSTLKLGHDRFLPSRFQFIIHLLLFHSTPYSLSYWKISFLSKLQISKVLYELERMWQRKPLIRGLLLICLEHRQRSIRGPYLPAPDGSVIAYSKRLNVFKAIVVCFEVLSRHWCGNLGQYSRLRY